MIIRPAAALLMSAISLPANGQTLQPPAGAPPGISMGSAPRSQQELAEQLTEPGRALKCTVKSVEGREYSFALRYSGPRGYLNPATGQAEATKEKLVFTEDPSDLFSAYSSWSFFNDVFGGSSQLKDAPFGPQVRLLMRRTDFDRDNNSAFDEAVLVQAVWGYMPLTKAVGFCRTELEPQAPMDEAEARDHLARP
ncbi:hypothetical protein [Erythrobacter oryzae]|uniref:hypothetical protein n=1 Tax=Erythrobacter oryzae TaxID=3019556 RepID=UPI002554F8CC|nr:hypothetical protein [Erythrobacter sp. COR-2]